MHPQIERDGPGGCPICSMALERKGGAAEDEQAEKEIRDLSRRFWIAAVLTIPVFFLAMGHLIPGLPLQEWIPKRVSKWIVFVCAGGEDPNQRGGHRGGQQCGRVHDHRRAGPGGVGPPGAGARHGRCHCGGGKGGGTRDSGDRELPVHHRWRGLRRGQKQNHPGWQGGVSPGD